MTPSEQIVLSVIIPVWNGADRIAMTLDALAAQTADPALFEVIVVDNGSTDGTADIVRRYPFVTLLSEPKPGSYRARNRGVAVAKGEYTLFTDGDCVPTVDWVKQALKCILKDETVGIWAGHITLFMEAGAGVFSSRYDNLISGFDQERNAREGRCVTANWLCQRDTLLSIGGFDSEMLSGGDVDCARRFLAAGHSIVYASEMQVGHPTRANVWELARKRRRVVGGRWQLRGLSEKGFWAAANLFTREAYWHSKLIRWAHIEKWAKPGVLLIAATLLFATYYELLRLKAGYPPYRS